MADRYETEAAAEGKQLQAIDMEDTKEPDFAWEGGEPELGVFRITREQLAAHLRRREARWEAAGSLPCSLAAAVIFALLAVFHSDPGLVYAVRGGVGQALLQGGAEGTALQAFGAVGSAPEFWRWADGVLSPMLFGGAPPQGPTLLPGVEPRRVVQGNVVVGGLLIQQERAAKSPCKHAHSARSLHPQTCHSGARSACWETGTCAYDFNRSGLGLSSNTRLGADVMYIDLAEAPTDVRALLAKAQAGGWLDAAVATKVRVQLALYNAELGAYALASLQLEFERGGMARPSALVSVAPYLPEDGGALALRWLFLAGAALLLLSRGLALVRAAVRGQRLAYCTSAVNLVDWATVLLCLLLCVEHVALRTDVTALEQHLIGNGHVDPNPLLPRARVQSANLLEYSNDMPTVLQRLERSRAVASLVLLLLLVRLARAADVHPRLRLVVDVLCSAASKMLPVALLAGATYCMFGLAAHLMFGGHVRQLSSLQASLEGLYAMLLLGAGDPEWDALRRSDPTTAAIFVWAFFLAMVYFVYSAVVAIVLEAYTEVRRKVQIMLPIGREIASGVRLARAGRARRGGGLRLADLQPANALRDLAQSVEQSSAFVMMHEELEHELGLGEAASTVVMEDCGFELKREQEAAEEGQGGAGGGGGMNSWTGSVMANHSECLARILEGTTEMRTELRETKARVNNMAARMGVNTVEAFAQTHVSYQPSNRLLKRQPTDGMVLGSVPQTRNDIGVRATGAGASSVTAAPARNVASLFDDGSALALASGHASANASTQMLGIPD